MSGHGGGGGGGENKNCNSRVGGKVIGVLGEGTSFYRFSLLR